PAGHAGLRDAVDLLETPTEHGFGELLEVPEADVAGDADRHDRLAARIGAQHDRARRTLRQDVAQRIDLLAHVERGEIHVRAARSGRTSRTASVVSRALSAAKSMSVPHAKRRTTSDAPSRVMLSTRSTPGTVATCCSTGSVTKRSTSAGATSG